jgi:hypothetical protein
MLMMRLRFDPPRRLPMTATRDRAPRTAIPAPAASPASTVASTARSDAAPADGALGRLHAAFTAHPASVGESYGAHCRFALGFAGRLALAAGAAAVHAVLPFLFEKTASRMIGEMHDRLHRR